ncbi:MULTISPECIES: hypothetical protein [Pectobacterium]|uniref:Uncharacterized protein n=1 Tax=Pectobacterium carotovorum TaxID=554 RepID=A0A330JIA3_PECCA|nr:MULTISPECIES: hypothetical protein [Pectobacterium]RJL50474.1 hypothetical protein D5071_12860 [Pectobacterium carotovorum]
MNSLKPTVLLEKISELMSEGSDSLNKQVNLSYNIKSENDYYSEEVDMEGLYFKSLLERINISFLALIEAMQLPHLLINYKKDFAKFDGKHTNLSLLPYIGEWHNETLDLFWKYHKTLSSLLEVNIDAVLIDEKRSQLERILINTPKIVKDRNIEPQNETAVKKCVYELLIHVFSDTVKEISIAKETKTYKPDLGVKSLKCAVEYKFADSEQEVKTAIGGIYEDMKGYDGSEDWTFFYAVIYMTDAFFTTEQILSELSIDSKNQNWKPILVFGKGHRKSRDK